ncbi:MAG TPA: triose-phosphate isomerase [Candidatus Nanoarchaeia archaeon]|nr:triose-phosphate isomerase [Candidatus Nanoarchaeia archaeon]
MSFQSKKRKPLVLINLKTYPQTIASSGLSVVKQLAQLKLKNYSLAIAPSLLTVKETAESISQKQISIFAQHADTFPGAFTGSIPVKELQQIGVQGVIVNHSEKKVPFKQLQETIALCRTWRLQTVVCASRLSEVKKIAKLHPDYIAYEPKKLIGGNISVTTAKPKIIIKALTVIQKYSPKTQLLVGAGVHNNQDLTQALLLGASGVLIGHAIATARNPGRALQKLLD